MAGNPTLRRKLLRDIRRTWALFAALVVAVALGLALFAGMNNSYLNLNDSYQNAFAKQGFPDLFVTAPKAQAYADSVSGQEGVQAVRTRVQADLPMQATEPNGITDEMVGRIIGYPSSGRPEVASLTVLSGAANPKSGHALAEEHFAETFALHAGDSVTLTTAAGPVKVVIDGVVASAEYFWPAPSRQVIVAPPTAFGALFVSEDDAVTWSGAPANQALVLLTDAARDGDNATSTLDSLRTMAVSAGATNVYDRAEQPSNSVLTDDLQSLHKMAVYFPILFLLAAGLAIYVLLSRRVTQERQIIGTLRATGVAGRTLGWHYMSYALLAGVLGALIGLPIGVVIAGGLTRAYAKIISLPESLTVFGGVRPATLLLGIVFALVATGFAAWWPSRRAMRIMPAEAMRAEVPSVKAGRSWIEKIVPGSRHFSAKWGKVLRDVGRSGARSFVTAIGVALSILLILATFGLVTSLQHAMDVEFDTVMLNQGQAQYAAAVTKENLDQVASVPGVTYVEPAVNQSVSVAYGSLVYATALTALNQGSRMHGFVTESGDPVPMPSEGFLVDQSLTTQLPGLQVGDTISVTFTGLGDTTLKGPVKAFTYNPLGAYVYADRSWLVAQVPTAVAMDVLLQTADDADQTDVRKQVSALAGVVTYVETAAIEETFREWEQLFYLLAIFMVVLGAIMAFAIIFTTMSISIVERSREIATMVPPVSSSPPSPQWCGGRTPSWPRSASSPAWSSGCSARPPSFGRCPATSSASRSTSRSARFSGQSSPSSSWRCCRRCPACSACAG